MSAQAYEPDGTLRLNENLGYTYDASRNLASRTDNTLAQAFSSDALNQLASITRSGTLTVSGSITGAVATLGVNGQAAAIYSMARSPPRRADAAGREQHVRHRWQQCCRARWCSRPLPPTACR